MTEGWGRMDSPFDDIFARFFGSGLSSQPPVQRVDLGRFAHERRPASSPPARRGERMGNSEITPEHLLYAAAQNDSDAWRAQQHQSGPGRVCVEDGRALDKHGTPKTHRCTQPQSGAKLALRTAQQQASESGSSYIGPEHILIGIAANSPRAPPARRCSAPPSKARSRRAAPRLVPRRRSTSTAATSPPRPAPANVDPVVWRAKEVEQTVEILSPPQEQSGSHRRSRVARRAIVEGLAQRIVQRRRAVDAHRPTRRGARRRLARRGHQVPR